MLVSLSIRNVLLIKSLDIEFSEGLNVLTGETGAGKSILLDSLGYALGGRGLSGISPTRNAPSVVTAQFKVQDDHPVYSVLSELEFAPSEELLLRRSMSASGRSSCFLNDERCSAETLHKIADYLIEIHGQDVGRSQMVQSGHRLLLDEFAGSISLASRLRRIWQDLQAVKERHQRAEAGLCTAEKEIEFLRHSLKELNELNVLIGEVEDLSLRRSQLKAFIRYRDALVRAEEAMGTAGAEGHAAEAIRWLESAKSLDSERVDAAIASVDRAMVELDEANRALDALRSELESDPYEIERVEDRLHKIKRIARKHAVQPDELPEMTARYQAQLNALTDSLNEPVDLAARVGKLQEEYNEIARKLSKMRRTAANRLDKAVNRELKPLKLGHACFRTEFEDCPAGAGGMEVVSFTASTNPSTPTGPINKIASGGEFSRFMLALKVCLASRSSGISLIFDEIDRGIGGATADAVGKRLNALGKISQVLVVTHSPQVASYGDWHWRIAKSVVDGEAETTAVQLLGNARTREIARMLSGEKISDEAMSAAASLIAEV